LQQPRGVDLAIAQRPDKYKRSDALAWWKHIDLIGDRDPALDAKDASFGVIRPEPIVEQEF
jgi:hypothetical protein